MSTGPSRFSISPRVASISTSFEMSARMLVARPPLRSMSA
jgi:hypothetical protein